MDHKAPRDGVGLLLAPKAGATSNHKSNSSIHLAQNAARLVGQALGAHVCPGSNAAETVMPDGAVCPLLIR
jgi:hypothetical protein